MTSLSSLLALLPLQADVAPQEITLSLFDLAISGGPLMLVLLLLSIVAVFIFGKKWWMIRSASKIDSYFMEDIKDFVAQGKISSAKELCQHYDSPVARLVEKGLDRIGKPLADTQAAVENMGNVEVARLEKGLSNLAMISGGAPMIGFLGTVAGMIRAFFNMSTAGNNIDISLLSGGIYTAMVTTVGGLVVGILAYFGYNFLTGKISNLVFEMENTTVEFMDLLNDLASNGTVENKQ